MVEMEEVYMLSDETIFTPVLLEEIIYNGHSRIPVYHKHKQFIVGMLLITELIRLNPHEKKSIEELELVEIPHVSSVMPLFDILKQFKTGKSQMAIVLDAEDNLTPIGIITLEDVIETLIGDEIYDEIDFRKMNQESLQPEYTESTILIEPKRKPSKTPTESSNEETKPDPIISTNSLMRSQQSQDYQLRMSRHANSPARQVQKASNIRRFFTATPSNASVTLNRQKKLEPSL